MSHDQFASMAEIDEYLKDIDPDTQPEPEPEPAAPPQPADPEPATAEAAESVPEDGPDQPEPEPAAADEAATADEAGPATEPEPQLEIRPFHFKVDGTAVEVPGAHEAGDYIVIHKDAWNRNLLPNWTANRGEWRRKEREFKHEIEQLRAARSEQESHAAEIAKMFDALVAGGEENLLEWAEGVVRDYPRRKAEATAAFYKQMAERKSAPPPIDREALDEDKQATLRGHIRQHITRQQAAGLVDEDRLFDRLWNDRRLYHTADRDLTLADGTTLPKGGEYIDPEFFYGTLDEAVMQARRLKPPAPAAAARNAAAVGKGEKPKPAPAARPADRRAAEPKEINDRESWEQALASIRV